MPRSDDEIRTIIDKLRASDELGGVGPTEAQLRALLRRPDNGPVQMVNLLKFRDRACYPTGHPLAGEAGGSGAEAYARYGAVASRKIVEYGGRIVLVATAEQIVIGDAPEWDQTVVVEYPTRAAFVDMILDAEYQTAHPHRLAGLERTVIIATTPLIDASRRTT